MKTAILIGCIISSFTAYNLGFNEGAETSVYHEKFVKEAIHLAYNIGHLKGKQQGAEELIIAAIQE